ncbi:MAG TPA: hypothetical protein VGR85_09055 [Candidatus Limnocylindria bacterium]|nr:hypothetical protein [Candidatus Limnocylindria bacterium]
MYPLKQSTAITVPFFAHDANGDGITGLVDGGFTKRISKNGGAFAAMTVTVTEMENGWYSIPVSTAHTDTLGLLTVSLSHASIKRVNMQFRVHANLPDDHASSAALATVQADTDDIQGRLPAALVSGRIDASVGAMAANVMTAAAAAADLTTELQAGLATSAEVSAVQADTDNIQTRLPAALVGGRMDSSVGAMAADVLTAAATATDFATEVATAVWASGTRTLTSLGASLVQEIWDRATSALTTAGSVGKLIVDNLNATVSSRATQTSVDTIDDFVDTEVSAIKAKTDQLTFTNANKVDSAVLAGGDFAQAAADKVWGSAVRTLTSLGTLVADIWAGITGAAANKLADHTLRRSLASAAASADGDAVAIRSLLGAARKLANRVAIAAGVLTIYEEDDTTTAGTQAVTTDPGAVHIVEVNTN